MQARDEDPRDNAKKAYDQGCMRGMSGQGPEVCPYEDENLAAWWEAGWQEGHEAWERRHPQRVSR